MLSACFTNYKRHVLSGLHQTEVLSKQRVQAIQCGETFTILFEAANPGFTGRVIGQPGVGRSQHEHATELQALVHMAQEKCWVVEAVNEVGGQYQVITAELWLQVTGIALAEADLVPGSIQAEVVELACFITCLLYTSPSPRDVEESRMPSSA